MLHAAVQTKWRLEKKDVDLEELPPTAPYWSEQMHQAVDSLIFAFCTAKGISQETGANFLERLWGETEQIVVQDATVVEEAGSRKASAPPAAPGLAAAPESRTYSGTYSITVESESV